MLLELNQHDRQKAIRFLGDCCFFGPAICGLYVGNEAGPTEHAVLRLHALRPLESESRLLQDDGLLAVSQRVAGRACFPARASCGFVTQSPNP